MSDTSYPVGDYEILEVLESLKNRNVNIALLYTNDVLYR